MTQTTKLVIKARNDVEHEVKSKFEDYLAEERNRVNLIITTALEEIQEQMLIAKKEGISYDQADIKANIDLSGFSEALKKEVYQELLSAGWPVYVGGSPSDTIIKPY